MEPIKSRLLAKNRKIAKRVELEIGDGPAVVVELIKPTVGDRLRAIEAAHAAGEVDDAGNPKEGRPGALFAARLMATLMYRDKQPIFSKEEIPELLDAPWFEDLAQEMREVFAPKVEDLKGK